MHSVVMIPFAAPDKPIFFKNVHYFLRYLVFVTQIGILVGAVAVPLPVVGAIGVEVYRGTKAVCALPVASVYVAPAKSTTNLGKVFFVFRVAVQFAGD